MRARCACQVLAMHQAQLLEASRPGGALRWLGYLSSTGVARRTPPALRTLLTSPHVDRRLWRPRRRVGRRGHAAARHARGGQALAARAGGGGVAGAARAARAAVARFPTGRHLWSVLWRACRVLHQTRATDTAVPRAGPGRSILEARRGRADGGSASQRSRGDKRYISRCHVADIVAALLASMDAPAPGCVIQSRSTCDRADGSARVFSGPYTTSWMTTRRRARR